MTRQYQYVGPAEIAARVSDHGGVVVSETLKDSLRSMDGHQSGESLIVTFVVALSGRILIADRRSEHVICAMGQPVRSAGEMTFAIRKEQVIVERVTNQSTGYCPEPDSWGAVATALDQLSIERPNGFDPAFDFRRCTSCSQINVIKDNWFECDVCQTTLPKRWNFG